MIQNTTFTYNYSAKENQEIREIRDRYMTREENGLDELKRLDRAIRTAGRAASICVGICATLVFGVGLCLAMQVIGGDQRILGVAVGLVGMIGMIAAYLIHRKAVKKAKKKYVPRIMELTEQLTAEEK